MAVSDRHAAIVGRKVLAGGEKGRQRAIEKARAESRELAEQVLTLAVADIAKGNAAWGRPGRIARKMGGLISERHARRLLARLSGRSELGAYNSGITLEARHAGK